MHDHQRPAGPVRERVEGGSDSLRGARADSREDVGSSDVTQRRRIQVSDGEVSHQIQIVERVALGSGRLDALDV